MQIVNRKFLFGCSFEAFWGRMQRCLSQVQAFPEHRQDYTWTCFSISFYPSEFFSFHKISSAGCGFTAPWIPLYIFGCLCSWYCPEENSNQISLSPAEPGNQIMAHFFWLKTMYKNKYCKKVTGEKFRPNWFTETDFSGSIPSLDTCLKQFFV